MEAEGAQRLFFGSELLQEGIRAISGVREGEKVDEFTIWVDCFRDLMYRRTAESLRKVISDQRRV
jgi:hypothetical protein